MPTWTRFVVSSLIACASATIAAGGPAQGERIRIGGDGPVFPESITSTADGAVFTGSIGEGRVFKVAPRGKEAVPWSDKQRDGPQSVLGVLADERAGTLWACYSDMALVKGNSGKPAILRALDLGSGKVTQSFALPDGSFCNDIATGADQAVYATDTHGGRIMQLKLGANQLTAWFQDKRLVGVDGIAFGADGALYLTNVVTNELFRLDIAAGGAPGQLTRLQLSEPVKAPDGLRSAKGGRFYLAENKAGKIDELTVTGDKVAVKTLKSGYVGPTSMSASGDTLYIVEAKIDQYGKNIKSSPFFVYATPAPAD